MSHFLHRLDVKFMKQRNVARDFNSFSMKTYVLLYFEHKNNVIIIAKLLCRAVSCREVAL